MCKGDFTFWSLFDWTFYITLWKAEQKDKISQDNYDGLTLNKDVSSVDLRQSARDYPLQSKMSVLCFDMTAFNLEKKENISLAIFCLVEYLGTSLVLVYWSIRHTNSTLTHRYREDHGF